MSNKKNILVLTSKIPYPLNDGGSLSQFVFTDALQDQYNFTYILQIRNENENQAVIQLKKIWRNVNIIAVKTHKEATPKKNPKERSFIQKIKDFIVVSYRNKKKDNKPISETAKDYINAQISSPYSFIYPAHDQYVNAVQNYLAKEKVDLVQIEHLPFMNLIDCLPDELNTLYVHHELQFERYQSLPEEHLNKSYKSYIVNLVRDMETVFLNKFKNIITFSDIDQKKLEEILNSKVNIYTSPFPVLEKNFHIVRKGEFSPEKMIFQGSENHHPNFDALDWYSREIAPLLKAHTDWKLYVTGKWSEKNKEYLNRNEDFIFTGFLDDLEAFSKNSIMLVPVRIGSGIRTKILYAMAQGLPVISTAKGIEGINVKNEKEALIANAPEKFAKYVLELIKNREKSEEVAINGNIFVKNNYFYKKLIDKRQEILQTIL